MNVRECVERWIDNQPVRSSSAIVFGDSVVWSYGSHWPIAVIDRELKLAVINCGDYSRTTSKHTSQIAGRLAIAGYTIENVDSSSLVRLQSELGKMQQSAIAKVECKHRWKSTEYKPGQERSVCEDCHVIMLRPIASE